MENSISNFFKNLKYLLTNSIREDYRQLRYDILLCFEDYCKYELGELGSVNDKLNILNCSDTVDLLIKKPKSFCRFGDGEIDIINGKSLKFQKFNEELANKLFEILHCGNDMLYIGFNYNYFNSTKNLHEYNRKFYLLNTFQYKKFLLKNCNHNKNYIAANFNQVYALYKDFDFVKYYNKVLDIFKDKNLVIFAGKGVLDNIKYDVFCRAKSKKIILGPSINAYDDYKNIYNAALKFPKDHILCFILGPVSKVLVYDLTFNGYIAWDIGHLAKDYNSYMTNSRVDDKFIIDFYNPD